ncbi:MAG: serine/threonine-protein kinase [Actinomycetota bacterium]
MPPAAIGRYQVKRVLGTGGFATVYLAYDPDLAAWVAIKVLAEHLADDADFRDRFVREARIMRQLETPGLVTVYDIGDHQGAPYFVMEYCAEGTLADRLEALGRPLTPTEGVELARAIATCTAQIHRAGMVHRDLKPSNYLIRTVPNPPTQVAGPANPLLRPGEELAVADFGLAKVVDRSIAQASIAGGTPGYSAPEQFQPDATVDATADVYAASAMVASAITGRQPTPVLAPGTMAFSTEDLTTTGPLALELIRGLSIDRTRRHTDVDAWFRALSAASTSTGPATPHVAPPTAVAERPAAPPPNWAPPTVGGAAGTGGSTPSLGATAAMGPPTAPTAGSGAVADVHAAPASHPRSSPDRPTLASSSPPPSRRRGRRFAVAAAVVALAVAGGGGFLLVGSGDDPITGPTTVVVGQEAAFTATNGSSGTWTVNDRQVVDSVSIAVRPTTAGPIDVAFTADDGTTADVALTAVEGTGLDIVGPAHVDVGTPVLFTADGADADTIAWTVDGERVEGPALEIDATAPGTITIRLDAGDRSTDRTVIAIAAGQ